MAASSDPLDLSLPLEPVSAQEERLASRDLPRTPRSHGLPPHLIAGGLLVVGLALAAILAPLIAPYSPTTLLPDARLLPPSAAHWFGTDSFGRDLFSRVVFGARLALRLSLLAVLISALPGILLGLLAG